MTYLEQALKDGHAEIIGEGKQQKILYNAVEHTERYSDPEEHVRAEFWAELIYRYQYEPIRIGSRLLYPIALPLIAPIWSCFGMMSESVPMRWWNVSGM